MGNVEDNFNYDGQSCDDYRKYVERHDDDDKDYNVNNKKDNSGLRNAY